MEIGKRILIFLILVILVHSCEKDTFNAVNVYIARIAGFDQNCSTCLLEFPDDSLQVIDEIGRSTNNYYNAINMNKGNYEIGQKVKVRARRAEPQELKNCLALYPSISYENIVLTDHKDFGFLKFNDTIEIKYKDCLFDPEERFYLCLDSVLNDSRCPVGVYCFWEGNAEVKLKFEKLNQNPIYFNLNTHLQSPKESIIDIYKFTLVDLLPYPSFDRPRTLDGYKVKIIIEKIN